MRHPIAPVFIWISSALLALAPAALVAQEATPATDATAPRLTAILVAATGTPLRVPGSDGLDHLEYDLLVTNGFAFPVTLTEIVVATLDGRPLLRLAGDGLMASTQPLFSMAPTAAIPASAAVAVVVDVAVPAAQVPDRLTHQIAYDLPADASAAALTASRQIVGPELVVDPRSPVVLAPPLHGPGWFTASGCCAASSQHRAGRNPVDGARLVKPETFAIDWGLLRDGKPFDGDGQRVEQWFGHGAEVTAAAAGTVVFVRDDLPERPLFSLPTTVERPSDLGGNQVIMQIGPDVWAFYAHLQPGSVAVAVGDAVAVGQPIGRLGNSGNSLAPHLHFGLLDGPDPFTATSLPFVLDRYTLTGAIDPDSYLAALTGTGPLVVVPATAQPQVATLPLNLTVTDFGSAP